MHTGDLVDRGSPPGQGQVFVNGLLLGESIVIIGWLLCQQCFALTADHSSCQALSSGHHDHDGPAGTKPAGLIKLCQVCSLVHKGKQFAVCLPIGTMNCLQLCWQPAGAHIPLKQIGRFWQWQLPSLPLLPKDAALPERLAAPDASDSVNAAAPTPAVCKPAHPPIKLFTPAAGAAAACCGGWPPPRTP